MAPRFTTGAGVKATLACTAAVLLAGCAGAPSAVKRAPPGVHDYYPLREGSAWSYDVDAGDGLPVLAITKVERVVGDAVSVRTGHGLVVYRLRTDGIMRADGSYLLRAPLAAGASWPSSGTARATVREVGLTLETSAGRFEGCLRVREQGGESGAVVDTAYCPHVGPVEVISRVQLTATTARAEARLRGFVVGP